MQVYRTTKFQIYPTARQAEFINTTIELCRKMFNMLLKEHYNLYTDYTNFRKNNNLTKLEAESKFFKTHKRPVVATLKKSDENFKLADSLALEYEQKNIKMAFNRFFNSNNNKPKFKKKNDSNSYITRNVNNNLKVSRNYIRLPKIGKIKARGFNKKYTGIYICIAKIVNEKNGKYYVHITYKYDYSPVIPNKTPEIKKDFENVVGLDFKVGSIFTSSDNMTPIYTSKYYIYLEEIQKLQKHLKKKFHKSKTWFKLINKIRNLHKKIANYRKDFQHKLTNFLCKKYDYIVIETLNLKDIAKKLKNGTNTYDTSYGLFTQKLTYKIKGTLIKINKWYPSSKTCCNCGKIKKKFKLSQQTYYCNRCGLSINRDLNAATNIKFEGLRMFKES